MTRTAGEESTSLARGRAASEVIMQCPNWGAVVHAEADLRVSLQHDGRYTLTVTHWHYASSKPGIDIYAALTWEEALDTSEAALSVLQPGFRHPWLKPKNERLF